MAVSGRELEDGEKKGKAVYVLHTWKDCLWELGGGGEAPEPREVGGEVPGTGDGIQDGEGNEVEEISKLQTDEGDKEPSAEAESSDSPALSPTGAFSVMIYSESSY